MMRWLVALALLTACTRSGDPRLYTLVPEKGRATYPTVTTIEVRRASIAGYLDRREIVRAVRDEQLDLAADAIWAEPLDAMIGRVLAMDLALRLPKSRVFSDSSSLAVVADARVDIEVQRFEQGPDALVLRALVALHRAAGSSPVSLHPLELEKRGALRGTESTVAAMSELLGRLADHIASTLSSASVAGTP